MAKSNKVKEQEVLQGAGFEKLVRRNPQAIKKSETPVPSAKVMLENLLLNGVNICWGYPGGAILPLYDHMYSSKIKHILVRHEQGAAFAAEGFARATGKLGVAIATSGPGATNLITGIANANMDSIPVLYITGQVATRDIGTDAFQEADTYGMSIPITKYNALIKNPDDVSRITNEAILVAMSRRPGPVLIDFPKDIQAKSTNIEYNQNYHLEPFHFELNDPAGDINQLADAFNRASRPLLYVGGGAIASDASKKIIELAEKASVPVVMTLMGLGAFPGQHELSLGMVGMHGTAYANKAVMECDFIISLGARFDDRVATDPNEFASQSMRAQIDIDSAEIEKRVHVDIHIQGDLNRVLNELIPKVNFVKKRPWIERTNELKKQNPLMFNREENVIKPQYFIHRLSERTKGNAIVVTDVGQHQMWAAQFYTVNKPRNWITSGGLGCMGFGLPAAIGAKFGRPDEDVVLITGDGSIQMNIQELATARMYNVGVKIVLFHNGFLGMVRQWQELFYEERYSSSTLTDMNPDFVKLAQSYGIEAKKISKPEEIEAGIDFLWSTKGPVLLEVMIPEQEKVYPMIPAGHKYEGMIQFDTTSEKGELFSIIPHQEAAKK